MSETSRFESCIQQRKTICLLSIRISLACARASKLTTTNKDIQHFWHLPSCSSGWMRKHAFVSIFVVGHQRIILTGVLPIDQRIYLVCVAHMGPTWVLSAPGGPHEPCYQGYYNGTALYLVFRPYCRQVMARRPWPVRSSKYRWRKLL